MTHLETKLGTPLLEVGMSSNMRQLRVDRGPHAGSAVGRTAVVNNVHCQIAEEPLESLSSLPMDVAEMIIVGVLVTGRLDLLFNRCNSSRQSFKDLSPPHK